MQTIGLTDKPNKEENIVKRIFWPGDNASDADALGQQGCWICIAAAVLSSVALLVQGHWILAPLFGLVYFLGGYGIREHSVSAAVLIAAIFSINVAAATFFLHSPSILDTFIALLLVANIRGTWVASKWQRVLPPDELPVRFNETLKDRLIDIWPAKIWPHTSGMFFVFAGLMLLLTAAGTVMMAMRPALFVR